MIPPKVQQEITRLLWDAEWLEKLGCDGTLTHIRDSVLQLQSALEEMQQERQALIDAVEQALDDMGEDSHCVWPAAKKMLRDALPDSGKEGKV